MRVLVGLLQNGRVESKVSLHKQPVDVRHEIPARGGVRQVAANGHVLCTAAHHLNLALLTSLCTAAVPVSVEYVSSVGRSFVQMFLLHA